MSKYNRATEGLTIVGDFTDQVKGRTFLITGPSEGGIGAETAISLAHGSPATLILLGRSPAKAESTIEAIRRVDPQVLVKFVQVDLASLKSVREAAQAILQDPAIPKINVVINNAGVMGCPYRTTEDGLEFQLAANHLGHFVLTNTIMPKVKAAGTGSRIVFVSSSSHRYNPFRFRDPNFAAPGSYDEAAAYGSSKVAMMLYAVGLKKRLAPYGIHVYTLHPGSISTGLQVHAKSMGLAAMEIWDEASWRCFGMSIAAYRALGTAKTVQQGCSTTLRAALDPDLVNEEGIYLEDANLTTDNRAVKEWATDPELAERCWQTSEELVSEKFSI
ncbi:uncharacterized protein JN550_002175 [Neoarthrinium moseri]|uniref:uncharacterized protein n=1 Tax=Neoarthrinium moseri TaxID=1658444 RepID=UPI001FDBA368|nr:uncharacterized protein JN550_002175 [Neoarthrinium moseri]KAI1874746.1 hypothetical protein JN550_002175 [Neoarthrinium moseri]